MICFSKKRKKNLRKSKKRIVLVFVLMIFVSCFFGRLDESFVFSQNVVYAQESDETSLSEQLTEEVENQLSNLDFSDIETVVSSLTSATQNLFASTSFSAKVRAVLTGEYSDESESFFSSALSLLFSDLKSFLPLIASVICIAILGGMVSNLKPATGGGLGGVIHFVTYGLVILILGTSLVGIISTTTTALTTTKSIFDAIFPILLTLLTAVGGTTSVGVYQPAIAILSEVISGFFTYALLPIFIFSVVFSLVGNLSNSVKLDKFVSFLQGLFKWSVGLCFTIFLGFVSIQGVLAGSVDGLSIRTAKYAIKSYVPIVGSYISDGLSIITASTALIKNAVGGVGLFLLLSSMITPIFSLVIFMLSLKFMAGVIEPIGEGKIANFISDLSKSMSLLVALLVAVAFMYLVLTGLIMMSANTVLGL